MSIVPQPNTCFNISSLPVNYACHLADSVYFLLAVSASSRLAEWTLILYGTATDPQPPRPPPPKPTKPTTKPVPPPRPGKTTSTTKEHTPNVKHETQAITMSSKATTTTAMTYPSHIQHSTYRSTPNEVIVKSTTGKKLSTLIELHCTNFSFIA